METDQKYTTSDSCTKNGNPQTENELGGESQRQTKGRIGCQMTTKWKTMKGKPIAHSTLPIGNSRAVAATSKLLLFPLC